jgi:predicted short-subunit dehydrogenase-like oxidoreductase (DUF2520 family)
MLSLNKCLPSLWCAYFYAVSWKPVFIRKFLHTASSINFLPRFPSVQRANAKLVIGINIALLASHASVPILSLRFSSKASLSTLQNSSHNAALQTQNSAQMLTFCFWRIPQQTMSRLLAPRLPLLKTVITHSFWRIKAEKFWHLYV